MSQENALEGIAVVHRLIHVVMVKEIVTVIMIVKVRKFVIDRMACQLVI